MGYHPGHPNSPKLRFGSFQKDNFKHQTSVGMTGCLGISPNSRKHTQHIVPSGFRLFYWTNFVYSSDPDHNVKDLSINGFKKWIIDRVTGVTTDGRDEDDSSNATNLYEDEHLQRTISKIGSWIHVLSVHTGQS